MQSLIPNYDKIDHFEFTIRDRVDGKRLDHYLASRFDEYTRTFFTKLIKEGNVTINEKTVKPSAKIRTGYKISVFLPQLEAAYLKPAIIPLDVVYEDDYLIVINKSADLVVHPARGHMNETLVNGLVHYFNELSSVNGVCRPGIVHRLDRFTSGLIVIAKNDQAHVYIAKQFEDRVVKKEYLALVEGVLKPNKGTIALPIGMDPRSRERMTITHGGKPSETNYQVIAYYPSMSLVHVFPKTGRTHQIRVHLKSQKHPIVGDTMYGAKHLGINQVREILPLEQLSLFDKGRTTDIPDELMSRQALHAWKITLQHPQNKQLVTYCAPLAEDFKLTIRALQLAWPNDKLYTCGILDK